MKKTRKVTAKRMKLWVVLALVLSLVAVQTIQIIAEASEDKTNPSVTVSSISELIELWRMLQTVMWSGLILRSALIRM